MKLRLGVPEGQEDSALAGRLAWLTFLRLIFLCVLLGIIVGGHLRVAQFQTFSVQLGLIALASSFALAAANAALLRSGKYLRQLCAVQLVFDQLTWTVVVYLSGGAISGATSLYGLTALTGAILGGLPAAALASAAGYLAYLVLCTLMTTRLLPPPPDQYSVQYATTLDQVLLPLGINLLVLIVVTLLASYLAERLRLAGGRLEEATERAHRAERLAALGKVASALAHEIRNPLGSISASVELLREAQGLHEDDRRLCDIIQRESARLNDLVGDMLDLTRPRKPDLSPTDLASVAREVVTLASRLGRSVSDVQVVYQGPEQPQAIVVQADPGQVRQLIWNLVRNAVQATAPATQVVIRAAVSPSQEALIEVCDQGPGISAEAKKNLFDAFFTTRAHGTGIGLAVVKRITDDHGWQIEVLSAEGTGTTFRVTVPNRRNRPSLLPPSLPPGPPLGP